MPDPGTLVANLQRGGTDASVALAAIAEDARPNAAYFEAYTTTLLEYIDAGPAPELRNLAIGSLCALIERTEFSSPEPLQKVAPFVLPPLIHALAAEPRIAQLSPALETLWLANRAETEQALRQWGLVSSDVGLRLAALAQLEAWVSGLNGRFAFRKFTPLVVSLLRDSSEVVRDSSYRLIVKFFASTSARAREDLVEIMRKQRISDASQDKIMSAISRELSRSAQNPSRPPSGPPSRPSSRSESASPVVKRTPTPPKSTSAPSEGPLDLELDVVRESAYAMQKLDPVNVFTQEEFLSEVSNRLACFEGKETEGNWSQRQEAVQRFRQMLRCTYVTISPDTMRAAVRMMQKPFTDTLLSLRTTLVGFTCQAVKDIAQLLPATMIPELLDPLLDPLSHVAAAIKKITASAAHICICAILIGSSTLSARQFQTIKAISESKKPHARTYALYWLKAALLTSHQPVGKMDERASEVEHIVTKGITDAVHAAREGARQLYWVLYELWPDLALRVSSRLPASAVKTLQASKPRAERSIAVPVNASASTGPASPRPSVLSSTRAAVHASPKSPRPSGLVSEYEQAPHTPAGLGIINKSPGQPMSGNTHSTPRTERSSRAVVGEDRAHSSTPASRQSSLGISDSIADLSIRESSEAPEPLDLEDPAAVKAALKEYGTLSVLRRLAVSNASASSTSTILRTIRDQVHEVSSAADIARLIQTDLSGASMTQRLGYLQLLERLNYEQDTVESVRPATSPAPSSIRSMRPRPSQVAVYVDSESSGPDASPQSARSTASVATSPSSSISSIGDPGMDVDTSLRSIGVPSRVSDAFSSARISAFPSTEPACRTYIEGLVQQVEQQTAKPEIVAALAVLVTASAAPHSRKSPLYAAVDVWHRSYTFDMHLRDVILRYLSTRTDTDSVLLALVLLRVLLITPTQAPASAYLDPLACIRCLLGVLQTHGGACLEIDEHALPAVRDAVMKGGRAFGSRSLLELLATSYETASKPTAKAFIVQTLDQAVAFTGLLVDEGAGVLPLVLKALDDSDARVRKEAYPVLVSIQKHNELLGAHAQTRMHSGQRRLLQHYLEIRQ